MLFAEKRIPFLIMIYFMINIYNYYIYTYINHERIAHSSTIFMWNELVAVIRKNDDDNNNENDRKNM